VDGTLFVLVKMLTCLINRGLSAEVIVLRVINVEVVRHFVL
jgi:hypothetical protein